MYSLLTLQTGLSEFKSSSVKIVKADFCHFLKHSLQFSQLNSSNKHDFFLIRQRKVSYICLYSQIRTYINFQYKYIFNMCFHNILLSLLQRGVKLVLTVLFSLSPRGLEAGSSSCSSPPASKCLHQFLFYFHYSAACPHHPWRSRSEECKSRPSHSLPVSWLSRYQC